MRIALIDAGYFASSRRAAVCPMRLLVDWRRVPRRQRLAIRLLLVLGVACGAPALGASGASAAPVTLYAAPSAVGGDTCADAADACPLATAIGAAPTSGAVTIDLASGSYPAQTVPAGSESLTLDGPGAVIAVSTSVPALTVNSSLPALMLEQLSIEGGSPGIQLSSATSLTLLDTAVVGNATDGLAASAGTVLVEDSTFAGNGGYGVDAAGTSHVSLYGTTFDGNTIGGLAVNGASAVAAIGGDLLDNNGNHDCALLSSGTVDDQGYNDSEDGTCSPTSGTSHANDSSLQIAGPAANGGPNETARLQSVADADVAVPTGVQIGGETGQFCAGTDERGVPRTQGPASTCDGGSYQYAPPVVTGVSPRSALELGLAITLSGYSLGNVTSATFGGAPATITSQSAGSVSLNVPASLSLGSQPITLTNTDGGATVPFSAVASPSIAALILTPGALQVPYSQSIPIAGGAGPYTYALQSGALPGGLSLSSSGVISGTPTKAGGSAFAVQVTDANGVGSTTVNLSLVIATPVVNIVSTRVTVAAGAMAVSLACVAAPCAGTASLTASVTVKLKHHRTKLESVSLASARYSLSAGQTGAVELTLTPLGAHDLSRRVLKKAKKHRLSETLNATIRGGTTATTTVSVT